MKSSFLISMIACFLTSTSGQNVLIGMFQGVEHQMGCDKEWNFLLCADCEQYADEIEVETTIKALQQQAWTYSVTLSGTAGTDCGMMREDGLEQLLLWEGCCSPIGDSSLLTQLSFRKGDICEVQIGNLLVRSPGDLEFPERPEILNVRALTSEEVKNHFVHPAEDYDDW